jgi:hypothetical protein
MSATVDNRRAGTGAAKGGLSRALADDKAAALTRIVITAFFKKIHSGLPIYSARIDRAWRAVGVLEGDTVVWFWIGSHANYETMLRGL